MTQLLLAIDASTYVGTAAVFSSDGRVIAQAAAAMRGETEERLMPAVAEMLGNAVIEPARLDGVVCGSGPGSFTSLRIAAAIAKGLAAGAGVPMFALSSLLLIPAASPARLAAGRYLALLDAMRGDSYALAVNLDDAGEISVLGEPMLLGSADLQADWSENASGLVHIGPGRSIDVSPHARGAAALFEKWGSDSAIDIASWEPNYGRLAEAEVRLGTTRAGRGAR